MRMVYGNLPESLIPHIKDHGRPRYIYLSIRANRSHIMSTGGCSFLIFDGSYFQQKIKNPNYKGKWKIPYIDNPGTPSMYIT